MRVLSWKKKKKVYARYIVLTELVSPCLLNEKKDELCQQDLSQLIEAGEEVEVDITTQDEE